jgi:hypothetical protein
MRLKEVLDKHRRKFPNLPLNETEKSQSSKITLEDCIVFVCADSSFANTEGLKSQCGYVIGLSLPELKDGDETPVLILEANSSSIKKGVQKHTGG